MRYAMINISTGIVENVIEVDSDSDYTPPDGYEIELSDTANIGDTYADGVFTPPPPPVPTPEQVLAANTLQQASLMYMQPQALTALYLSIDFGSGNDVETVKARAWQTFFRDVQAVDLSAASPAWPSYPA